MSTSVAVSERGDAQKWESLNLILAFFTALSEGRYDDAQALLHPQASWWVLHRRGCVKPAVWFSGFATLFPEGLQFEVVGTTVRGAADRGARGGVRQDGDRPRVRQRLPLSVQG